MEATGGGPTAGGGGGAYTWRRMSQCGRRRRTTPLCGGMFASPPPGAQSSPIRCLVQLESTHAHKHTMRRATSTILEIDRHRHRTNMRVHDLPPMTHTQREGGGPMRERARARDRQSSRLEAQKYSKTGVHCRHDHRQNTLQPPSEGNGRWLSGTHQFPSAALHLRSVLGYPVRGAL